MRTLHLFVLGNLFVMTSSYGQASDDVDPAMEAEISAAWTHVEQYFTGAGASNEAGEPNPQIEYAEDFFRYFRIHPNTSTGLKAGQSSFIMWGNLGAAQRIDDALEFVPYDSELWGRAMSSVENAYSQHDRREEFFRLLERLEDDLTHPHSRSEVLLLLGNKYARDGHTERALSQFQHVIDLAATTFYVQSAQSAIHELVGLNVGQKAPDFEAVTIDGETISLTDLRGKVVLLDFWATSCRPCIPEIPYLRSLHESLDATQFQLVSVSQDDDIGFLRTFLAEHKMQWPQIMEPVDFSIDLAGQTKVTQHYNVYAIPRSFLIDRSGEIVAKDLRGPKLLKAVRSVVESHELNR